MQRNPAQIGFWRIWTLLVIGGSASGICGAVFSGRGPDPAEERGNRIEIDSMLRLAESATRASIEAVRIESLALLRDPEAMRVSGRLRAWAEVEGIGRGLGDVRRRLLDPARTTEAEIATLTRAIAQAKRAGVRERAMSAIPVSLGSRKKPERIWFVFSTRGTSTVFALVEPADVFAAVSAFAKPDSPLRAFLVSDSGTVLAHSFPSYIGASFDDIPLYRNQFKTGATSTGESIDRLQVLMGSRPVGELPLRIAIERPRSLDESGFSLIPWIASVSVLLLWMVWVARQISSAARSAPAQGFAAATEVSASSPMKVAPGISGALDDFDRKTDAEATGNGAGATVAGPAMMQVSGRWVSGAKDDIMDSKPRAEAEKDWRYGSAKAELDAFERTLRIARDEADLLESFEMETAGVKDPRSIARSLVSKASELTGSPALFFLHDARSGLAQLVADAGLAAEVSPAAMSFKLDGTAVKRITDTEARGETASLHDQPELARALMARMGIAHFEAWAVTGPGPLGSRGSLRLLGVLVILQSGVDSFARRDSLNRMLKATGRIYERSFENSPFRN